ncbi:DUF2911 domain-containing protein [Pedobacter sp. LMG 31464]|uniref:DUF2911 domain-containing protein n=1 Tax=Pedobacter planticolens TaxID=2679964 RepID=A0A923IWT3_9SPHI|nr:DUF2911 domain-containing protein [Pedobacter planticolens]MBB2146489.1 DUF2911 domain-containing protein [Pedobacter planticolens]
MKTTIKTIALLFVVLGMHAELNAQGVKLPQASSGQTIVQDLGLGKITLSYSRPNVKGRKIFGNLEPYDKVWRTGANTATVIKFTDAVKINGQDVPAGEYGLFTIPNKTEWTVILNKTPKQWGAYDYKEADDILRIKVKPMTIKDKVETFTMQFANVLPTSAQLDMMWENTAIAVNITTSIDEQVMASIDAAMKTDKKPYVGAAQYYLDNGKDLATALNWMNEAEKANPKVPYIKLWKAKIQLKMGDIAGAQATAQAGVDLATANKDDEYVRLNTWVLEEAKRQTKSKSNDGSTTRVRTVTTTTREVRRN